MLRITKTDAYIGDAIGDCPVLDDCQRMYCPEHRLLYRECETAERGMMGDHDVIGGTRSIVEATGECPKCQYAEELKRFEREMRTMGGRR